MSTTKTRKGRDRTKVQEMRLEALGRAREGVSDANYDLIIEGFAAKGIPEDDILPRENVFTFHAWLALGRSVMKGEHGVKVFSWVDVKRGDDESGDPEKISRRRVSATVFHISQTKPVGED